MKTFKNIPVFEQEPIAAYSWNQNLGDLIGSKEILDGKVERIYNNKKQLYCRPCLPREITFVANKFWEQTTSQVTELAKRSKILII